MERLQELNRRLAEIQDELMSLGSEDFARKYELQVERDQLREETSKYARDRDFDRASSELIKELKALRNRLIGIRSGYANAVGMAGSMDAAGSSGAADSIYLNAGIDSAHGVDSLVQRIARLETILEERGHL